jgi:uncharacterized protein YdhG (YjbR/CyaY superfamily)
VTQANNDFPNGLRLRRGITPGADTTKGWGGAHGRSRTLKAPFLVSVVMAPPRAFAPKTIDEYMARVSPEFRTSLQLLRRTIKAAAPDAEEVISYQMPAFRQNGMLVYFAAFKDHCSLFVGSALVRSQFSAELKPFETGKGTLHFTPEKPLPPDLVRRIVIARVAENAARQSK